LLHAADGVHVYHAHWRDTLAAAGRISWPGRRTLITDTPYSARTHGGHDAAVADTADGAERRALDYGHWTPADVAAFVDAWIPLIDGWFVSITDDVLFPAWRASLEEHGRTTFADVPCVIRGMSVRVRGDGPSSWAVHAVVARPSGLSEWGTLPGGYVGARERPIVVGGKPLWLAGEIVRDYTVPGDVVIDPCCGGGTFSAAARRQGRRTIAGDVDGAHAALTASWLRDGRRPEPSGAGPYAKREAAGQVSLFGEDDAVPPRVE
jgi:hypothetical protein